MGQKVNPIIFRQPFGKPQSSVWLSKIDNYSQFLSQKTEIEKFLTSLSKSGGIIPKSFFMERTSESLELYLDLYFSFFMRKRRQVLGVTKLFKFLKEKYVFIPRVKYISDLMTPFDSPDEKGTIKAKPLPKLKKFIKGGALAKDKKAKSLPKDKKGKPLFKGKKTEFLDKDRKGKSLLKDKKVEFLPKDRKAKLLSKDKEGKPLLKGKRVESLDKDKKAKPLLKGKKVESLSKDRKAKLLPKDKKVKLLIRNKKSFSISSIKKINFLKGGKLKYLPDTSLNFVDQFPGVLGSKKLYLGSTNFSKLINELLSNLESDKDKITKVIKNKKTGFFLLNLTSILKKRFKANRSSCREKYDTLLDCLKKNPNFYKKYKKYKVVFDNGCKTRKLPSLVSNAKNRSKKKIFLLKNRNKISKNCKKEKLFFLVFNEKKKSLLKEKSPFSVLSVEKRSSFQRVVRIMLPKFNRLFRKKKTFYMFRNFNRTRSSSFLKKPTNLSFLNLNKSLCSSLQNFTGIEKVKIRFYSSQLKFLPLLKLHIKKVRRGLISFKRNKNFSSYFKESLQILFLVFSTFSQGNAVLLSRLITQLLQANRRQIFIVKFLKKALAVFFKRLPFRCVSLSGIRVMLKGRLNKRRRTKTIIIQQGQISSQTLSMPVDFHFTQVVTRYGSFGLRIWLSKKLI